MPESSTEEPGMAFGIFWARFASGEAPPVRVTR